MNEHAAKEWRELCIAAAFEEDPLRLEQIVAELNEGITERQKQLVDRIFERLAFPNSSSENEHKGWVN
jgi:hypothetical protein